ncbi:hypothetical protein NA56DRAFT_582155 [Hyaloscypha hepaticicola]|uniref:Uncharacterized protein n=1 Tax=Hyaloscypha hepaticicola TaxID=2082293 RepID=A0A2J6PMW5_9HELO|nr:hypothetical protein NA56DRAFT_582155 [Hyaloscypha hepaticicola]
MPKAVANPNGTVVQPEDSTLVQIGFDCSLNYEFVLSNSQSSAQIFAWLVPGVAMGLAVNSDEIVVHSLIPLPVAGCVTTVAQTFIPSSMVGTMKVIISVPSSPLYNINNATIAQLMDKINPAVPLIPGSVVGGGSTGTGSGAAAASSTIATANNGLDGSSGQTNQSPKAAGTTAGVVVLAIGGTAAYGAAMFLVARRYKRKKTSHRRSSSIVGPEMRYSGSPATLMGAGAFMSGGRSTPGNDRNSRGSGRTGNSARTQQISAPMMAENSLGWN